MHDKVLNNSCKKFKQLAPLFQHKKNYFVRFFYFYNHNLVKVYMECDYTCLNHNSIMSPKKNGHQGHDHKRDLV
jgi:hypothetical protein